MSNGQDRACGVLAHIAERDQRFTAGRRRPLCRVRRGAADNRDAILPESGDVTGQPCPQCRGELAGGAIPAFGIERDDDGPGQTQGVKSPATHPVIANT